MRRGSVVVVAALLGALSACTLLTSLDGLSDGAPAGSDASRADGPTGSDGGANDARVAADGEAGPSASALYAAAVLADTPIGYWRLEETGGIVAKDETAKHDGELVAGPLLGEPGVAGSRAAKLNAGTKARMVVATNAYSFPDKSPYTVEMWAKPSVFKNYQWLANTEKITGGLRNGWSLLVDSEARIHYEVWVPTDGGNDQRRGLFFSQDPLTQGTFDHLVMAFNGNVALCYIDGILTTTFPFSSADAIGSDSPQLLWGCRGDLSDCLDEWTLDELAIYDVALDGKRVKAHYDLGK